MGKVALFGSAPVWYGHKGSDEIVKSKPSRLESMIFSNLEWMPNGSQQPPEATLHNIPATVTEWSRKLKEAQAKAVPDV